VRIAKQGRAFGDGAVDRISQRPPPRPQKEGFFFFFFPFSEGKKGGGGLLNQAECVCPFQLTGPTSAKALENCAADKGLETKLSTTLTTLDVGKALRVSPQWFLSAAAERGPSPTFGVCDVSALSMRQHALDT